MAHPAAEACRPRGVPQNNGVRHWTGDVHGIFLPDREAPGIRSRAVEFPGVRYSAAASHDSCDSERITAGAPVRREPGAGSPCHAPCVACASEAGSCVTLAGATIGASRHTRA